MSVEIWDESEPIKHENPTDPDRHRQRSSPKRTTGSCRSRSPVNLDRGSRMRYSSHTRNDSIETEEINDPKATRTLFVGSLEPDITDLEVREAFERFAPVEQVDVKHPTISHAYAFVRFANVDLAVLAKTKMAGSSIRSFHCKIGYAKPLISNSLYISGLDNWRDQEELECFLNQFGTLISLNCQFGKNCATALFETAEVAVEVYRQLKLTSQRRPERRLLVDFADGVCGVIPSDSQSMPRQSSLIPLPSTAFPMVTDPIPPGLRPQLGFPTPLMNAPFDLMRGVCGPDTSAPIFNGATQVGDAYRHQQRLRQPLMSSLGRRFGSRDSPQIIDNLLLPEGTAKTNNPALSAIVGMTDLEAFLRPTIWSAHLHTKKSLFRFRCLHVVGDERLGVELSSHNDGRPLHLSMPQLAHIDASWMADAVQHLNNALAESPPQFCVLLALPHANEATEESKKTTDDGGDEIARPLTCLVAYLRLKQRAALLSSQKRDEDLPHACMLFTPSSFSLSLLKFCAPRLSSELAFVDDFLVILVMRR